ncbi:MAG: hypothetical protein KDD44_13925, partial [Bdellovibrionales bacterium]|nr:hypothetical protein [Bdellovibrionales bacterium]
LYWGVEPIFIDVTESSSIEDEILASLKALRDRFGIKPGARVVLTAGLRAKKSGTTNVMEIREIPRGA